MFPTGSKLLIGAAALAAISSVVYGVFADGTLGVIGLLSASVGLALVAGIVIATAEGDVDPSDEVAVANAPAATHPVPNSAWPVVGAFGGGLLVLGLVTESLVFVLGIVVLLVAAAEWMGSAWSDGASGDRGHNRVARSRMVGPLEYPLLAGVGFLVVVYSFSRIMLFLSKTGGVVTFSVIAAAVLLVAFALAYRPNLRSGALASVCAIGVLGLVAGGAVTGIDGEREMHPHETAGQLGEAGDCFSTEPTHADENASQTVAAEASIAATITLGSDGNLTAAVDGYGDGLQTISIPKSNPTNVKFTNNSGEDRRLVIDLGGDATSGGDDGATDDSSGDEGAATDEGGTSDGDEAAGADGESSEGEDGEASEGDAEGATTSPVLCTALVEDGGSQLLHFQIDRPSRADNPYQFVVPGVDGQPVEVVVP